MEVFSFFLSFFAARVRREGVDFVCINIQKLVGHVVFGAFALDFLCSSQRRIFPPGNHRAKGQFARSVNKLPRGFTHSHSSTTLPPSFSHFATGPSGKLPLIEQIVEESCTRVFYIAFVLKMASIASSKPSGKGVAPVCNRHTYIFCQLQAMMEKKHDAKHCNSERQHVSQDKA